MHDATKGGGCAKKGVGTRCNAGYIWFTSCEELGMRECFVQSLYQNSNHPSKGCANRHRRDEYTGGYLASIGDNHKECSHGRSEKQRQHHTPPVLCPESCQ